VLGGSVGTAMAGTAARLAGIPPDGVAQVDGVTQYPLIQSELDQTEATTATIPR
jgi:hypothetical protein